MTSKILGALIPADPDKHNQLVTFAPDDLDFIQEKVGGYFGAVDIPEYGATVWFDDSGLKKERPINLRATGLLWLKFKHRDTTFLTGDVLVTGQPGEDYRPTGLPEPLMDRLSGKRVWRYEAQTRNRDWIRGPDSNQKFFSTIGDALEAAQRLGDVGDIRIVRD